MAETRYRVTLMDRERDSVQHYDVDRLVMVFGMDMQGGETLWGVSLREVNHDTLAMAIATLLDRTFEVSGVAALALVSEKLDLVPQFMKTIDYFESRFRGVVSLSPPDHRSEEPGG